METFETIKKFLAEGGKCLLIEDGKPVGVVLTMEEYELLKNKLQNPELKTQMESKSELENKTIPAAKENIATHPIGEAMVKEMDFPETSADLADIDLADNSDVTLEDLGLDELPY